MQLGRSIWAIFLGGLVSMLATLVLALALALVPFDASEARSPGPGRERPRRVVQDAGTAPVPPYAREDADERVIAIQAPTPGPRAVLLTAALLAFGVGGYAAARAARRASLAHGALASWPSWLGAAAALWSDGIGAAGGGRAIEWVLAPLAGAAGAYAYMRRRHPGGPTDESPSM